MPEECEVLFKSGTTLFVESVGKIYKDDLFREFTVIVLKEN